MAAQRTTGTQLDAEQRASRMPIHNGQLGLQLVESLGLNLPGRQGNNRTGQCPACNHEEHFTLYLGKDKPTARCFSCGATWSWFSLAEFVKGDREEAKRLMRELGVFEDGGHSADVVTSIERLKKLPSGSLRQILGATAESRTSKAGKVGSVCRIPLYNHLAEQHSYCDYYPFEDAKPLCKAGSGNSGLCIPREKKITDGQTWIICEGPLDAAILNYMGYNAVGLTGCRLSPKYAHLFSGVDVIILLDRDSPGELGAEATAALLVAKASSVRIATLSTVEFQESKGPDVRDVYQRDNGENEIRQAIEEAVFWRTKKQISLPDLLRPEGMTDIANGRRFAELFSQDVRYCHDWEQWILWNSSLWERDRLEKVNEFAKELAALVWDQVNQLDEKQKTKALQKFADTTSNRSRVTNLLWFARTEPSIGLPAATFDSKPYLLHCENGTVDLRSGRIRPHRREDYLTQSCNVKYDPRAKSELWDKFLETSFPTTEEREQLIPYLQRSVGYSLTGEVREHTAFFIYGATGQNGKSVLLNTLLTLSGDYGDPISSDFLLQQRGSVHPVEMFGLNGMRICVGSEIERGQRLNAQKFKLITGGDQIRARGLFKDFETFSPSHTLWLMSNYKPDIDRNNWAMWRRLRVIEMKTRVPKPDKTLQQKLEAEHLPAILNWVVQGAKQYYQNGLQEPELVRAATRKYRDQMRDIDELADFLDERCVLEETARSGFRELFTDYLENLKPKEKALSKTMFAKLLSERKIEGARGEKGAAMRIGVRLKTAEELREPLQGNGELNGW